MSGKEEEDSQPQEKGRRVEGRHGDIRAVSPDRGQFSLNIAGGKRCTSF